ncbi:unnamed protein product [Anisakis simplex]|uniref:DUF659 domain-containing protein n=1 Tax=Anisakis simplex TaxID=6269 RepID=A0A0M3IY88_ANISI|nr:unnamed protein product [Anisakis simplex]
MPLREEVFREAREGGGSGPSGNKAAGRQPAVWEQREGLLQQLAASIGGVEPNAPLSPTVAAFKAGAPSPLLIEAICRVMEIQLLVHRADLDNVRSWKFGVTGAVYEVIREADDRYAAFIGFPSLQFVDSEHFTHQMDQWRVPLPINELERVEHRPSPDPEPRPAEPAIPQPEEREEDFNEFFMDGDEDNDTNDEPINSANDINEPTNDDSTNESHEEEGPAEPHYYLRRPHVPHQPREQPEPQVFRPRNIENLRPEHKAELTAPGAEAYHVSDDNSIWCRLAGCARPNQPFKTVKAWKIHVQRAACHREETLCTSCGHNVALPSSTHPSAADIKTVLDAHKAERCVGVTKRALVARKIAAERLVILGRDNSHIAVLDEDADEVQVPTNPRKRHLASEAAWRAEQCCLYLKRFKADHPDLMEQIGMEHQLVIQ